MEINWRGTRTKSKSKIWLRTYVWNLTPIIDLKVNLKARLQLPRLTRKWFSKWDSDSTLSLVSLKKFDLTQVSLEKFDFDSILTQEFMKFFDWENMFSIQSQLEIEINWKWIWMKINQKFDFNFYLTLKMNEIWLKPLILKSIWKLDSDSTLTPESI